MLDRGRLHRDDVERCSAQSAALELTTEGVEIDELRPGGVHHERALGHERELLLAEEPFGLGCQGDVERHRVAGGKKLSERSRARTRRRDLVVGERRVGPPDLESERRRPFDQRSARATEPDNAQSRAADSTQLTGRRPVPPTAAHVAIELDDPAEQRQDEGECMIGDLLDAVVGDVADPDTALFGFIHIEVVEADAAGGDNTQRRQAVEIGRPYLRLGSDEEADDVLACPWLATLGNGHAGSCEERAHALGVVDLVSDDDARLAFWWHGRVTIIAPRPTATVHEKEIEIRWNDLDAFEHVNHAVYLTYLDEARDEWLARATDGAMDYVVARVEIDYKRELTLEDDRVTARITLDTLGTSSISTVEELVVPSGETAAGAKAVLVACDAEHHPRPLTDAERSALLAT
jgi:acyl-CoA thioester hydrolase